MDGDYLAALVVAVGYLMVSTWRFYSFKDIHFNTRQPFRLIVIFGVLFAAIRYYSQPVLFGIALTYMFSGVLWRLQWIFRRRPARPHQLTRRLAAVMSSPYQIRAATTGSKPHVANCTA